MIFINVELHTNHPWTTVFLTIFTVAVATKLMMMLTKVEVMKT